MLNTEIELAIFAFDQTLVSEDNNWKNPESLWPNLLYLNAIGVPIGISASRFSIQKLEEEAKEFGIVFDKHYSFNDEKSFNFNQACNYLILEKILKYLENNRNKLYLKVKIKLKDLKNTYELIELLKLESSIDDNLIEYLINIVDQENIKIKEKILELKTAKILKEIYSILKCKKIEEEIVLSDEEIFQIAIGKCPDKLLKFFGNQKDFFSTIDLKIKNQSVLFGNSLEELYETALSENFSAIKFSEKYDEKTDYCDEMSNKIGLTKSFEEIFNLKDVNYLKDLSNKHLLAVLLYGFKFDSKKISKNKNITKAILEKIFSDKETRFNLIEIIHYFDPKKSKTFLEFYYQDENLKEIIEVIKEKELKITSDNFTVKNIQHLINYAILEKNKIVIESLVNELDELVKKEKKEDLLYAVDFCKKLLGNPNFLIDSKLLDSNSLLKRAFVEKYINKGEIFRYFNFLNTGNFNKDEFNKNIAKYKSFEFKIILEEIHFIQMGFNPNIDAIKDECINSLIELFLKKLDNLKNPSVEVYWLRELNQICLDNLIKYMKEQKLSKKVVVIEEKFEDPEKKEDSENEKNRSKNVTLEKLKDPFILSEIVSEIYPQGWMNWKLIPKLWQDKRFGVGVKALLVPLAIMFSICSLPIHLMQLVSELPLRLLDRAAKKLIDKIEHPLPFLLLTALRYVLLKLPFVILRAMFRPVDSVAAVMSTGEELKKEIGGRFGEIVGTGYKIIVSPISIIISLGAWSAFTIFSFGTKLFALMGVVGKDLPVIVNFLSHLGILPAGCAATTAATNIAITVPAANALATVVNFVPKETKKNRFSLFDHSVDIKGAGIDNSQTLYDSPVVGNSVSKLSQ